MPTQEVTSTEFWRVRLLEAQGKQELHQAVFVCGRERWEEICKKHKEILFNHIQPNHSILDAGCGYGRLLTMLPKDWKGNYVGLDLSPDLLALARIDFPEHVFVEGNLLQLDNFDDHRFDWAVLISIRPMLIRNMGEEYWLRCESQIRRVARKLLYLEYDPSDNGSVE